MVLGELLCSQVLIRGIEKTDYAIGRCAGLIGHMKLAAHRSSSRGLIALRVFLRLTSMDVCCGPPFHPLRPE